MKIDNYFLISKLGEGGFGEVWRATGPNGPCAIKRLNDPSPMFRDALRQEALKLYQLMNVSGVVRLLDHNLDCADPYLVLELADGTLDGFITGPMAPLIAAGYMLEVSKAVQAIHAKGVVHRDIKPENILFKAGVVKIADFGLGKGVGSLLLTIGGAGTPGYMAPEKMPSTAADVFGLGATLYHMLTGQRPPIASHTLNPAPFASCPVELAQLIRRMTAPHPMSRPALGEVISILNSYLAPAPKAAGGAGAGLVVGGLAALAVALFASSNRFDSNVGRFRLGNGKFTSGRFS